MATSPRSAARRSPAATSPRASSGCSSSATPAWRSPEMRRARPLLGTYVSVAVSGVSGPAAAAAGDAAFAAIARVERLMSFHDPGSDLGRLNRAAGREAVAVDPWTIEVVRAACDLQLASDGCFDISVVPELQRQGLLPGRAADDGAPA